MAVPCRFLVVAAPRTGSNWLCSLLDSHPEILCHHEIFNPEGIHLSLSWRRDGRTLGAGFETAEERDRRPLAALEQVWRRSDGARAVGFKMNLGQNPAALDAALDDCAVRKILLRRRNRVKTYVSEAIAERTGAWESYPDSKTARPTSLRVDPLELRRHAERNRAYYTGIESRLAAAGQRPLALTYEELPGAAERRRVLEALGADPEVELRSGTEKRGARDLRRVIENFGELAEALRGTELEPDLHAPGI